MEEQSVDTRAKVRRVTSIRQPWQDYVYRAICYVLSILWCGFTVFPLVWLLGSTFKDNVDLMKMPPDFFPRIPAQYTVQLTDAFEEIAADRPLKLVQ